MMYQQRPAFLVPAKLINATLSVNIPIGIRLTTSTQAENRLMREQPSYRFIDRFLFDGTVKDPSYVSKKWNMFFLVYADEEDKQIFRLKFSEKQHHCALMDFKNFTSVKWGRELAAGYYLPTFAQKASAEVSHVNSQTLVDLSKSKPVTNTDKTRSHLIDLPKNAEKISKLIASEGT